MKSAMQRKAINKKKKWGPAVVQAAPCQLKVAVVAALVVICWNTFPVWASEGHEEYCTREIGQFIEENNLSPSSKTIGKAKQLCRDFKEAEARKELLKSPRKPMGKKIRNDMGRCLEVAGGVNKNRTNVQIFECNGTKSQKWTITRKREIRNDMGRCLEVAGGVNKNRTNVQIFECNGTKSQKWSYIRK